MAGGDRAMNSRELKALEHVARLKADMELRRYAALHRHALALETRIMALGDELSATSASWGRAASLQETRLVNRLTRVMVEERSEVQMARARVEPTHEAARQAAIKAWGRAEALAELHRRAVRTRRMAVEARSEW